MALIDEYKQAIQDVLDGRAKPAPKPSELPWTEDKAATMWAAAAAELIAEASGSSGGGVLVVGATMSDNKLICDKTCKEMWDAMKAGGVLIDGLTFVYTIVNAINDDGYTFVTLDSLNFNGSNDNDYPMATIG